MSAPPEYAAAGEVGATEAAAGGAADAAPFTPVANVRMRLPSETLSPSLTLMSLTTPSTGDGTSIVALSDSSEMSGSSAFTVSPAFTNTSMIGMSLKSPMSGTLTSTVVVMVLSLSDQHAAQVREQA